MAQTYLPVRRRGGAVGLAAVLGPVLARVLHLDGARRGRARRAGELAVVVRVVVVAGLLRCLVAGLAC